MIFKKYIVGYNKNGVVSQKEVKTLSSKEGLLKKLCKRANPKDCPRIIEIAGENVLVLHFPMRIITVRDLANQ